jgi:hypothetical protein
MDDQIDLKSNIQVSVLAAEPSAREPTALLRWITREPSHLDKRGHDDA